MLFISYLSYHKSKNYQTEHLIFLKNTCFIQFIVFILQQKLKVINMNTMLIMLFELDKVSYLTKTDNKRVKILSLIHNQKFIKLNHV